MIAIIEINFTTILWTVFLMAMLFFTVMEIICIADRVTGNNTLEDNDIDPIWIVAITCSMWAVWYMYYLH